MKLRRHAMVALLSSLVALAPPAAAAPASAPASAPAAANAAAPANDTCVTTEVNVGLAGAVSVVCVTENLYVVTGDCVFAAVLTPDNQLTVVFGGAAAGVGPQLALLTYIFCEVYNSVGDRDSCELANGGPVSTCLKMTGPWRVAPISVCVKAFVVFGPSPVTIVHVPYTCAHPPAAGERPDDDPLGSAPADLVQRMS